MRRWYLKPWLFGIIAGGVFVFAEAILNLYPPTAYTFCLTCHARDFVNTVVNLLFKTNYQTTFLARRVLMTTSLCVMAGAFIAARLFDEYRRTRSTRPILYFITGFIIMIAGIVIFGCPTRIIIRSGYGDVYAIAALIGMFVGILNGTTLLKILSRVKFSD
jgi:uncharacterized membrane protein